MNQKKVVILFTAVGIIGSLFGIAYAFFGLGILPVRSKCYLDANPDAPSRERYTLKDQNPEKNAPFPKLYRWFWGLFE